MSPTSGTPVAQHTPPKLLPHVLVDVVPELYLAAQSVHAFAITWTQMKPTNKLYSGETTDLSDSLGGRFRSDREDNPFLPRKT